MMKVKEAATDAKIVERPPELSLNGCACHGRSQMMGKPLSSSTSPRSSTSLCPPGHLSITDTLQAKIDLLEAELAKVEAAAAGHRADFERERDRAASSSYGRKLVTA